MNFFDEYELFHAYYNLDGGKRLFIDKRIDICRFCGKNSSTTKFDKSSHALPESLGNKILFSLCECRECNTKFGEAFEDSFGKFVLPFKVISQIYGKKNTIHYKDKETNSELLMKKNSTFLSDGIHNIHTIIMDNSNSTIINTNKSGFTMTIKRQPYVPQFVYYTLLKIGYGIIPQTDCLEFVKSSLELGCIVRNMKILKNTANLSQYVQQGFLEFVPGTPSFTTSCYIYKKKKSSKIDLVNYFFVVTFGNFSLQIALPTDEERQSNIRKTAIPIRHYENSIIDIQDFNTIQNEYSCNFEANIEHISDLNYVDSILRENNLIKN